MLAYVPILLLTVSIMFAEGQCPIGALWQLALEVAGVRIDRVSASAIGARGLEVATPGGKRKELVDIHADGR